MLSTLNTHCVYLGFGVHRRGYCTTLEELVQYVCTPEQTTRLHSLWDKLKFQKKLPTSKGRRDELTRVVRELMTAILQVILQVANSQRVLEFWGLVCIEYTAFILSSVVKQSGHKQFAFLDIPV